MKNIKKTRKIKTSLWKDPIINKVSFPSGLSFILDNDELLKIEKTNPRHIFGIAVDLGTTSVCVSLCNLESGQELATATQDNEQYKFAQSLLNRKKFISNSQKNQKILSDAVLGSINKALDECIRKSGVIRNNIYTAMLVGSPIMGQILLSIPDSPKQSLSNRISQVKAAIVGIKINKSANIKFIPGFNDYIGSDVLATIISLKMLESNQMNLCVDLGMRAKIILGNRDGVFIASTSINSVFEGHNIKCGMVTQAGAIKWVRIKNEKVDLLSIGHIRPQGICGSGIIDIVSEMLKYNILSSDAKMKNKSFTLYEDKKSRVEITQKDILKVQESKAAVSSAIAILMKKMKIKSQSIKKVYLAGQLGGYLNSDNLVKMGLIPADFKNKISYVGNAAFLGAKLALLSKTNMDKIIESRDKIKHIVLEDDKSFKKEFKKALPFSK